MNQNKSSASEKVKTSCQLSFNKGVFNISPGLSPISGTGENYNNEYPMYSNSKGATSHNQKERRKRKRKNSCLILSQPAHLAFCSMYESSFTCHLKLQTSEFLLLRYPVFLDIFIEISHVLIFT